MAGARTKKAPLAGKPTGPIAPGRGRAGAGSGVVLRPPSSSSPRSHRRRSGVIATTDGPRRHHVVEVRPAGRTGRRRSSRPPRVLDRDEQGGIVGREDPPRTSRRRPATPEEVACPLPAPNSPSSSPSPRHRRSVRYPPGLLPSVVVHSRPWWSMAQLSGMPKPAVLGGRRVPLGPDIRHGPAARTLTRIVQFEVSAAWSSSTGVDLDDVAEGRCRPAELATFASSRRVLLVSMT